MRRTILTVLLSGIVVTGVAAQPKDGDLILTYPTNGTWPGGVLVVDPNTAKTTTLTSMAAGGQTPWVRMAENNRDLLVCKHESSRSAFVQVTPGGAQTTILRTPNGVWVRSFELDHDNTWMVCGVHQPTSLNCLWSLQGGAATPAMTSLFQYPGWHNFYHYLNELVIDRDPSAKAPYVLAMNHTLTTMQTDKLYGADRTGVRTTLVSGIGQPLLYLRCIELNPCTGDYLTCTRQSGNHALCVVSKDGRRINTLATAVIQPDALKIMQDGTAWVVEDRMSTPRILRVDATTGAVFTLHQLPPGNVTQVTGLQCIEVYGSRRLVCNLPSSSTSTVQISVQCRSPFVAPGITQYALAASFSRRPGVRMPNGEFLNLNVVSDPLFHATALNLLPGVFVNFRGVLGPGGVNQQPISVNIPAPVRGSGVTVFVAGVIYNAGFVVQVTNSHGFVV